MERRMLTITQDELATAMDYMEYEPTPEGVWGHLEAMTKEAEAMYDGNSWYLRQDGKLSPLDVTATNIRVSTEENKYDRGRWHAVLTMELEVRGQPTMSTIIANCEHRHRYMTKASDCGYRMAGSAELHR